MTIAGVTRSSLAEILPLIAQYQVFYGAIPDPVRNAEFFGELAEAPERGIQFVYRRDGKAVGFATLYFVPSSISAQTYCVLNDLFTLPEERGAGVGRALIEHCRSYARRHGFAGIEWQTAVGNRTAQRLYDRFSAQRSEWYTYSLGTGDP